MSIGKIKSTFIAVSDNENLFLDYFIHIFFVSKDSGYKFESHELLPSEEGPHQIFIYYTVDSQAHIKELESYATRTINIKELKIPKPQREGKNVIVEPAQTIEIHLKEKDKGVTKAKSIAKSGNIVSLSKGEIGKTTA